MINLLDLTGFQNQQLETHASFKTHFPVVILFQVLRRDLQQAIRKKRPGKEMSDFLLHQDNAPPHVSAETRLELSLLELETVPHAPYSPDLAPMDFAIFPEVSAFQSIFSFNMLMRFIIDLFRLHRQT